MHRSARRHFARLAPLLALPALAVALLPASPAHSATAAAPKPITYGAADTKTEQRSVATYWTAARMAAAKPLDAPAATTHRFVSSTLLDLPDGAPTTVKPTQTLTAAAAVSPRSTGEAWDSDGAVVKTVGRVFFTLTGGSSAGRNASCSGSAVTSSNRSVVMTAGHCVKNGGSFHSNWVFVPGYDQGNRPNGTWVATSLLTTPQWNAREDMNFDLGAAVVAPLDGRLLTEAVGGQGIAFNQSRGRQMYSFGYPAASPYNGSRLIYCSGRAFDDFLMSEDVGLNCDMTGGSSGGPWFINFNENSGLGLLNSVNSFKYNFANYWMFGPYFGSEAQALYNAAQRTSLT
ncbi:peptidase [Acrocarpospora corrugata]|uniref:Peptidase n=1 Tax=Acrocarpospora corrugata TaxID=35763 RepID=A0A5M3W805_9ACTN|nr:trypsin-like peptidase domain-containing protein [Acrocarpospora corrugata]GES04946.1 peptidase [Acrocarpospora corrugata]